VKSCPYCQNPIPEKQSVCPACGAAYWDTNQTDLNAEQEKSPHLEEEEEDWKWSIILIPGFLAALIVLLLIAAGFIIQLFTHFENNQTKIMWITGSILAGIICYRIFRRRSKPKISNKRSP
jgi:hypothetical protein